MIPTRQMQELLRQTTRQAPFRENELRRVEGMGEMYLASPETPLTPDYIPVASLTIDDGHYRLLFRREHDRPQ